MPRKSPYQIRLSPEEKNELVRRAAKYTLPYYHVLRARMILLVAEGLDNDAIAARRAGGQDQRQHRLALAFRGCDPAVAAPLLDLSAGSGLCGQSLSHSRSVRAGFWG